MSVSLLAISVPKPSTSTVCSFWTKQDGLRERTGEERWVLICVCLAPDSESMTSLWLQRWHTASAVQGFQLHASTWDINSAMWRSVGISQGCAWECGVSGPSKTYCDSLLVCLGMWVKPALGYFERAECLSYPRNRSFFKFSSLVTTWTVWRFHIFVTLQKVWKDAAGNNLDGQAWF